MQFFQQVNTLLTENKVIPFPESGNQFLDNEAPEDPLLKTFNEELVDYIRQLMPIETDVAVRQDIVDKISERVASCFKKESTKPIFLPCGSCMSGTFLPTADIDFALFFFPLPCNPVQVMEQLQHELSDLAVDGFTPIPTARVPVLKFIIYPGINIDISFDELHGPLSVLPIREIFQNYPCLLPAQLFFKAVLHKQGLDQPYTGGISSYILQLMLLAYVQHSGLPKNITEFVLGVCDFYGNKFNFTLTGIDVSNGGSFFSRYEAGKLAPDTPAAMYMKDPLNPNNILGHNAFKMNEIREQFREIHKQVLEGNGHEVIESLNSELDDIRCIHAMITQYDDEHRISSL